MRRFRIAAIFALVHAVATYAAMLVAFADFARDFPHGPSLLGEAMGGLAYLLSFPLMTGTLYLELFPLFGPAWQPLALLAANSALWGVAAALLRRRAPGGRESPGLPAHDRNSHRGVAAD